MIDDREPSDHADNIGVRNDSDSIYIESSTQPPRPAPAPKPQRAEVVEDDDEGDKLETPGEAGALPPQPAPDILIDAFAGLLASVGLFLFFSRDLIATQFIPPFPPFPIDSVMMAWGAAHTAPAVLPALGLLVIRNHHPRQRIYMGLAAALILALAFTACAQAWDYLSYISGGIKAFVTLIFSAQPSQPITAFISQPWLADAYGFGGGLLVAVISAFVLISEAISTPETKDVDEDGFRRALKSPRPQAYFLHKAATAQRFNSKSGIVLGQLDESHRSKLLVYGGLEGQGLVIAPPRTNKTVFIINNMLANKWPGAVWSFDPKAQALAVSCAARRNAGRKQIIFDPFKMTDSNERVCLNPLSIIRRPPDPGAVQDVAALLECLIPPVNSKSSSGSEKYFSDGARNVLNALTLWVLAKYKPEHRNFYTVKKLLALPPQPIDDSGELDIEGADPNPPGGVKTLGELFAQIMSSPNVAFGVPAQEIATLARAKSRGDIMSTAAQALKWLDDPRLRDQVKSTSIHADFLLHPNSDNWIVCPPSALYFADKWIRMMIALPSLLAQAKRPEKRVLFLVDEVANLGYSSEIVKAFRLAGGLGISYILFPQDIHSMAEIYGHDGFEILKTNSEFTIYLGVRPTDNKLAEQLSKALGEKVVIDDFGESKSSRTGGNVIGDGSKSKQTRGVQLPLMSAFEIQSMPAGKCLMFVSAKKGKSYPIRFWAARYWQRKELKSLAMPDPYNKK